MSQNQNQFQQNENCYKQKEQSCFTGKNIFLGVLIAFPAFCLFKKSCRYYTQKFLINQNYTVKGGKLIYQDFRGNYKQLQSKINHVQNDLRMFNYPGSRQITISKGFNFNKNYYSSYYQHHRKFMDKNFYNKDEIKKDSTNQIHKYPYYYCRGHKNYFRNQNQVGLLIEDNQINQEQLKQFIQQNPSYKVQDIEDFQGYQTQWNSSALFTDLRQPFKSINRYIGGLDHETYEKQDIQITLQQGNQNIVVDCIIPKIDENKKFPEFQN